VELVPLEQALGAAIGIETAPCRFDRAHRVELARSSQALGRRRDVGGGDGRCTAVGEGREQGRLGLLAPDAIGPGADQALQFDDGHERSFR
jgi:hypothetical protein